MFKAVVSIYQSFVKTEIKDLAGNINLIGGILYVLLIGGIFIKNCMVEICAVIWNRTTDPISYIVIVIIILGLPIYFILCVKMVKDKQKIIEDGKDF